ncbi:MAG TPA: zf-HC2 domain-containing protein [Thermoanaerobaculia bacterium]|nr:zf-HC2 domain-containing protein [Thermoanaerobaculia bacterium]
MDKPSFEESLRALAARRPREGKHPTLRELVDYRAGELPAEEDDRIQEHLTQCRDCAQLLLDLSEFEQFPPPPEDEGPVDARAEAAWQRFRTRLGEPDEDPGFAPPILRPRPPVPFWRRPALPWALAAALALSVVGLWQRTGTLQGEVEKLSVPQMPRVVTLASEDDGTRGGGEEERFMRAGERVTVDLVLSSDPTAPRYPLYSVEIIPATGKKSISVGQDAAAGEVLRVDLPSAPQPGDYFFEVSGIEGGRQTPVGRYPFKVLPPRP